MPSNFSDHFLINLTITLNCICTSLFFLFLFKKIQILCHLLLIDCQKIGTCHLMGNLTLFLYLKLSKRVNISNKTKQNHVFYKYRGLFLEWDLTSSYIFFFLYKHEEFTWNHQELKRFYENKSFVQLTNFFMIRLH